MLAAGGRPPIGEALEFSLVEVELGRAVFEGVPGRRAYSPMGAVHGGYAATLLDSGCGIATASRKVRAEGTVVSMGRRVAFAEAKVTDVDGTVLASATSTLLVTSA